MRGGVDGGMTSGLSGGTGVLCAGPGGGSGAGEAAGAFSTETGFADGGAAGHGGGSCAVSGLGMGAQPKRSITARIILTARMINYSGMNCPSCHAVVEDGADLCLECGEPLGDSVVARASRAEVRRNAAPMVSPKPSPVPPAVTVPGKLRAKRAEEPVPVRCPGCGIPTTRDRCPGCGSVVRREEE